MYSIKNLLQSAQMRQTIANKAPTACNAPAGAGLPPQQPWMPNAVSQEATMQQNATQMQYFNPAGSAGQGAFGMAAAPLQPAMIQPQFAPAQPAQMTANPQPQSGMRMPPQIPPQLPTPVIKSGAIYRDLMKKHDRFTQRHL